MMDRFSIEVETIYRNDAGTDNNVFGLSADDLRSRVVDVMNFVKVYSTVCIESKSWRDKKLF